LALGYALTASVQQLGLLNNSWSEFRKGADLHVPFHHVCGIMPNRSPDISKQDNVTIVTLGPEYENLDEMILGNLQSSLLATVDEATHPLLVLDLSNTQFFGSSFLEVLLQVHNRLTSKEGGRFAISGLTTYCAEVISITHLDRVWETFPTVEEAVDTLKS
jgi:anti-sigma B factor antagonist